MNALLRVLLVLLAVVLLAACRTVVGVTVTPTATVIAPPATPTQEFATPVPGCPPSNPSAHCHHYFKPLNTNPEFEPPYCTWPPSRAWFGHPSSPEQFKPIIQEPCPAESNDWYMAATGRNGDIEIPDWHPSIFCKPATDSYCEINVTSIFGTILAVIEALDFEEGIVYLAKVRYRFNGLRLSDPAVSYAQSKGNWREMCSFHTDSGLIKYSAVQTLRDDRQAWSDDLEEEIVVAFYARQNLSAVISCGFNLTHAAWNGQVQMLEFSIMPTNWGIEAAQVFLGAG